MLAAAQMCKPYLSHVFLQEASGCSSFAGMFHVRFWFVACSTHTPRMQKHIIYNRDDCSSRNTYIGNKQVNNTIGTPMNNQGQGTKIAKIKLMFREAIITRAATRRLSTASFDVGMVSFTFATRSQRTPNFFPFFKKKNFFLPRDRTNSSARRDFQVARADRASRESRSISIVASDLKK